MLWTTFLLFALAIVLLFSFSQNRVVRQTYKETIARELAKSGKEIQSELVLFEQAGGRDYGGFLISRTQKYDVRAFILKADGTLLFPNLDDLTPALSKDVDFAEKIVRLKESLRKADAETGTAVLYEDRSGEYVYGARLPSFGEEGEETYLYISRSLKISESILSGVRSRTVLLAVFVMILSFAVAGSISGMLVKPIAEMTEKAGALARGDFSVDFRGTDYGSEVTALADTLNYARDELSKTDRMQKELIANVSHDFKTPLTMIKAYASMIKEISGGNPEKREKHAQVIIDEADRLASLVNDVLDLSKISSGLDVLKLEDYDLSAYTLEVLEKFGYLADTQGYHFQTDIESELFTRADPAKIGQVLYNLIGNAVNYTGEDKTVRVALKKEGEKILFSVSDSGKGIKKEELASIWERYYRSADAHKRPVKGTGLGLSIVKTILERHRFRFGVESEVGEGSTFYVLFPLVGN
ncbi:MAG: HAMP domain-containing histidine kinase [Clostridia bacterium]|nr:HAMP domain-containing histidine kinase [Clostridia bacterium]